MSSDDATSPNTGGSTNVTAPKPRSSSLNNKRWMAVILILCMGIGMVFWNEVKELSSFIGSSGSCEANSNSLHRDTDDDNELVVETISAASSDEYKYNPHRIQNSKNIPSSALAWQRDHCWRDRIIPRDRSKYDLLVTGSGYSATGYFAKSLTAAGYEVGHEKWAKNGMSDWLMSSRQNNKNSPFIFRHIFLLVRHPLKVLHSEYGTRWNFKYTSSSGVTSDVARYETLLSSPLEFNRMKVEFRTLEYWLIQTMLAENIAECYFRAEDISSDLLLNICLRAELPGCETKDWEGIVNMNKNYNSHNNRKSDTKTWAQVKAMATTETERKVLRHALEVCAKYYGPEECS